MTTLADDPKGNLDAARSIDQDHVRHIAFLIRLALTEAEVARFSHQLSAIVEYFNRLQEVDVSEVPPYQQPAMSRARLRPDEVGPSMAREDLLANAPQHQDGYVRVPVVLDTPEEA